MKAIREAAKKPLTAGRGSVENCGVPFNARRVDVGQPGRRPATDITKYTGQYSSTMASERIESAIFLFSFEIGHTPSGQQLL